MPEQTTNEKLRDAAILTIILLDRQRDAVASRIAAILGKDLYPKLTRTINRAMLDIKSGHDTSTVTSKKLKTLFVSINEQVSEVRGTVRKALTNELVVIGKEQVSAHAAEIVELANLGVLNTVSSKDLAIKFPKNKVYRQVLRNNPMDGRLFDEWINNWSRGTKANIQQVINRGLGRSTSIAAISKQIGGQGGALNLSESQIKSIVQTSVNHISTQMREELYKENSDLISKVQLVATLDERTTDICISLDGSVWDVGDGPRPPLHFRCRTTALPVMKSYKELGIDIKQAPPGTRASMNGQVPEEIKYPEWLKTQSEVTQNKSLGVRRATDWRAGRIRIDKYDPTKFSHGRAIK